MTKKTLQQGKSVEDQKKTLPLAPKQTRRLNGGKDSEMIASLKLRRMKDLNNIAGKRFRKKRNNETVLLEREKMRLESRNKILREMVNKKSLVVTELKKKMGQYGIKFMEYNN